ncbi:MFS transporter [Leucobacter luti]|uniref:Putative proline/betaine transporter n=1 Tax=Leucobacter luti TaxID=340320 RepID=A0A4V3CYI8_9MICO|nr:MFS transporter [Leucobacter luti]MCW2287148.1 MFS family permease [Leucobacter luti]QYM76760.1 MHS family MFS transporter [Leucobacter luti]TCK41374.1 putative MFS family arabinose efflux permease [Leucobacter luti]TDP94348.1 putative MFS family arabinose efflux permease [Leucobacter luti]
MTQTTQATAARRTEERRVLAGTVVGTTIEWYDFFIYAQAAGAVFATLYFAPAGETVGQIVSWASLGISFLFRPLGAIVAGHLGDRLGRKRMLVLTLIMMGIATALIGVLPTYAQIGVAAPVLLILLRVLQGFSAGGEWGGAALMSVEHAPKDKRGFFGAYPQIGVPLGMILATSSMWIITTVLTEEQFLTWGWRIPFLLSILLILVGYFIRRAVEESPIFMELQERKGESSAPIKILFSKHTREVILAALIFIANNAAGYLLIAFFATYATRDVAAGGLGLERPPVLLATTLASFGWLIFTLYGGILSDRIGRVRTFQIGYVLLGLWAIPMWFMIDTGNIFMYFGALFIMTIGLGLSYGPQASLYAEMFPADVRYSGVSIGYAIGAIFGGAFAPMIADLVFGATGASWTIGAYILGVTIVSLIAVSLVKETRGVNLSTRSNEVVAP